MIDPTEPAGSMGPYGCSEREIEIARPICNSCPVINAFAAPEWAELDDGGRAWIATIVRQAMELGATLASTPPSEPDPTAPTLAGPLNAVLQDRAARPDRPFLSEGGGGPPSPLKGESEGLRALSEAATPGVWHLDWFNEPDEEGRPTISRCEGVCAQNGDSVASMSERDARFTIAAVNYVRGLLSRADTPAGAGGDVEPKAVVCVDPAGEPYWPSAKPTEAESRRVCFGVFDDRRREEVDREGWRCVPVYLAHAAAPQAERADR